MRTTVRSCDMCFAEVDEHWPLNLSAGVEASPTGEHLDLDFCSASCVLTYITAKRIETGVEGRE